MRNVTPRSTLEREGASYRLAYILNPYLSEIGRLNPSRTSFITMLDRGTLSHE